MKHDNIPSPPELEVGLQLSTGSPIHVQLNHPGGHPIVWAPKLLVKFMISVFDVTEESVFVIGSCCTVG